MKKNRSFARWICLLLIVVAIAGVTMVSAMPRPGAWKEEPKPNPEGLVLEDMPIVLPANATDVEKNAAKELQYYLDKLTGSAGPIVTEGYGSQAAIYVGATKFAAANNVTYTDNNGNGEGWALEAVGDSLVVTGGNVRGTLYAVYHLLEDEFGVHWWNMWEEYVPSLETATLPYGFVSKGEPLLDYRDIYFYEDTNRMFNVRNRLNGFCAEVPSGYGDEEDFARPYHVHTFNRYFVPYYKEPTSTGSAKWLDAINPDHISWYEEYPEWYAWSDVEQKRVAHGQMCLTNEEFTQVFIEKALIAIEMSYEDADTAGKLRPKYLDITPNDTGGFCECDNCEAVLASSGPSGMLFQFVNKIANAVAEVYPEIKVETLAYWQYFELPLDDTVPAENVVIRLANNDKDMMRDLDHPVSADIKERVEGWSKILQPGQLMIWDYTINLHSAASYPRYYTIQHDYQKYYNEYGVVGIFTEVGARNTLEFWDMVVWTMAKIMENPNEDPDELMLTFLNGYYGEAAAQDLYEYIKFATECADDYPDRVHFSYAAAEAKWMSAEDTLKAYNYFQDAIAKTKANPDLTEEERELFLFRLEFASGPIMYQVIANYNRYVNEMAALGDSSKIFPLDRAELATRYIAMLNSLEKMVVMDDHTGNDGSIGSRAEAEDVENRIYSLHIWETDYDEVSKEALPLPEIPQEIYEDHPGISDKHIYDYHGDLLISAHSYMYGMYAEKNGASFGTDRAVMWDLQELYDYYSNPQDVTNKYAITKSNGMQTTLSKTLYLDDPVVADGQWHLYRISDVSVVSTTLEKIYFFGDTVYVDLAKFSSQLKGKKCDVYVNLKLEGNTTGEGKIHGKVYMDRVLVVAPCDVVYSDNIVPATCTSNAYQTGFCKLCGKEEIKEYAYSKLPHVLTSGYTYDAANNVYKASCDVCGEAQFKFYGELPKEVMDDIVDTGASMDYVYDLGVKEFEGSYARLYTKEDPTSSVGVTAYWDTNNKGSDSQSMFVITNDKAMSVPYDRLGGGDNLLYANELTTNDGQFHIYKFNDVSLVNDEYDTVIFFDWSLQVDFGHLPIRDQKVDLYMSMKIEGDTTMQDPNNRPVYYVDRMIVVGACEDHKADDYTYNAETGAYEGRCDTCSSIIRKTFIDDLPQEVLDVIEANGTNVAHVYEYPYNKLVPYQDAVNGTLRKYVDDPLAAGGKALMFDSSAGSLQYRKDYYIGKSFALNHLPKGSQAGSISASELQSISGQGYKLYHWENILVPTEHTYVWALDWNFQMTFSDIAKVIRNRIVDIYLGVRVEGDPFYEGDDPEQMVKYYFDRMIVVDKCEGHADEDTLTINVPATCNSNAYAVAKCSICGKDMDGIEVPDSKLVHEYGEYVYNENNNTYISTCVHGCGATRTRGTTLPQEVLDDLAAAGIDEKHAHEYGADGFVLSDILKLADDSDAICGKAVVVKAWDYTKDKTKYTLANSRKSFTVAQSTGSDLGKLTYDMLKANENKGYKIYKLEDVELNEDMEYVGFFFKNLKAIEMAELAGKTVDLYISMKVEGKIDAKKTDKTGPVYYVDRIIAVDNCDQYDIEYTGDPICKENGTQTGPCPQCGNEFSRPTGEGEHKFVDYKQQKLYKNNFVAECEYGCGATDLKVKQPQTFEESLPEQLPASVRNHIVAQFTVGEIAMSDVRWDFELNRPVGVREYKDTLSTDNKTALNMSLSWGIPVCIWRGGDQTEVLGQLEPSDLRANSGKGYQLYLFDDIVPIEFEEYRFLYMFTDWGATIENFDDDLKPYKDEVLDVYIYLKVEGDPYCETSYPTYYFDQVIVAKACEVDEDWEIITEATCTKQGFAVGNCKVCGLEGAEVNIPMTPHNVINSHIKVNPTCKAEMVIEGYCTTCNSYYREVKVPDSKLEHEFTNYKKLDDGSGQEVAYCNHGCGARHVRDAVNASPNFGSDSILDKLPAFGGASDHGVSFSDIKSSDWYFGAVKNAMNNKLINGVSATEFRPNETLTTAQAIKLAAAYHERSESGEVTLTNGTGNWYSSYVDYAVDNGIVDGEYASMSTAEMNKPIDRSEFVAIFAAAMGDDLTGRNTVADNAIPDVDMDDENAEEIYAFYRAGILTGSDAAGTFNPHSPIKRSEVATILNRMFDAATRQTITLK